MQTHLRKTKTNQLNYRGGVRSIKFMLFWYFYLRNSTLGRMREHLKRKQWFDTNQSANKYWKKHKSFGQRFLCTVLSMTSESVLSDNCLEKESRLQFYDIIISCQKGINCLVSLCFWLLWSMNWSDTEN